MLRPSLVLVLSLASQCRGPQRSNEEPLVRDRLLPKVVHDVGAAREGLRSELSRFATTYVNEFVNPNDVERESRFRLLFQAMLLRTLPGVTMVAVGSEGKAFGSVGPLAVERETDLVQPISDLHRVLMSGGTATTLIRFGGSSGTERSSVVEIVSVLRGPAVIGAVLAITPLDTIADGVEARLRSEIAAGVQAECCLVYADEAYCGVISDDAWAVVTTRNFAELARTSVVETGDRKSVVGFAELTGDPPMHALVWLPSAR